MVRLIPKEEIKDEEYVKLFQSHYGSINTYSLPDYAVRITHFNPTMVRLILSLATILKKSFDYFNPTMVRLIHNRSPAYRRAFHYFNPTMVRLIPP